MGYMGVEGSWEIFSNITSVPCKCIECNWTGTVWDCEGDVDGDGNLGCPECLTIIEVKSDIEPGYIYCLTCGDFHAPDTEKCPNEMQCAKCGIHDLRDRFDENSICSVCLPLEEDGNWAH